MSKYNSIRVNESAKKQIKILCSRAGKTETQYANKMIAFIAKSGIDVYTDTLPSVPDLIKNLDKRMVGFLKKRENDFLHMEKSYRESIHLHKKILDSLDTPSKQIDSLSVVDLMAIIDFTKENINGCDNVSSIGFLNGKKRRPEEIKKAYLSVQNEAIRRLYEISEHIYACVENNKS